MQSLLEGFQLRFGHPAGDQRQSATATGRRAEMGEAGSGIELQCRLLQAFPVFFPPLADLLVQVLALLEDAAFTFLQAAFHFGGMVGELLRQGQAAEVGGLEYGFELVGVLLQPGDDDVGPLLAHGEAGEGKAGQGHGLAEPLQVLLGNGAETDVEKPEVALQQSQVDVQVTVSPEQVLELVYLAQLLFALAQVLRTGGAVLPDLLQPAVERFEFG